MLNRRTIIAAGAAAGLAPLVKTSSASAQQSAESTLDVVKKRGTLIVGNRKDFPPSGFIDSSGNWVGFDLDLAQYIADRLKVKLERVEVTSRTRIPLLQSGNIDLILATLGPTVERAEQVDMTQMYYTAEMRILTKKNSGIKSAADLAAPKKTGTVQGSADVERVLARQPKAELVYFQEWPLAALALKQGRVDAIATGDTTLRQLAKGHPELEIVGPSLAGDPAVIGVRHNDSRWRMYLDQCIMYAYADGTIAKLYKKYLDIEPNFRPSMFPDIERDTKPK